MSTSTTVDQASTTRAPRWPLVVVVALLLPLGVIGALVLSASSTVTKAAWHGVPGYALPAAVAVLELVNLAGSGAAVFGRTLELRRAGYVTTGLSTLVTASAGWSAYGWFGLVGPGALLGLVHLASLAVRELLVTSTGSSTASTTTSTAPAAQAAEPEEGPDSTGDGGSTDAMPSELGNEPTVPPDRPVAEPTGPVEGPATLVEWAADVRRRGVGDRAIARELDVTRHGARALVIKAENGIAEVAS